jgi:1,4-alpha-glucan branching enzyme
MTAADSDGKPAIAHGSRVKVKVTQHDGTAVDRVPAWIKVAQAPGGQMGAKFDGFHWSPPKDKQHQW